MALQGLKKISYAFPKTSQTIKNLSGAQFKMNVREIMQKWKKEFIENDISEPKESIEHIIAYTLGTKNINEVYHNNNKILSVNEQNKIEQFCKQRLKKMPIQYIIQEWDFRNLTLKMIPPVFIPRPETEQLVDLALNNLKKDSDQSILELCCGSGAISLAILQERPSLSAIALDKLEEACELTKENAELNGLINRIHVIQNDLNNFNYEKLGNKFNLIVSNPPYILTKDMDELQPEILLYEDKEALHGGADGLNIIKHILNISAKLLNNNGKLFLELDPSQPEILKSWLHNNSYLKLSLKHTYVDFCNKTRFVEIIKM